jgi:hypothetical protein
MGSLLSPSGGIVYHFRAWRYHSTLWRPFQLALKSWLEESWSPPLDQSLLLIGPSAGWCLPLDFLARFPKVIARDLDPLALALLKRRAKAAKIEVETQDGLGILDHPPGRSLKEWIEQPEHQGASLLFCNLWGQIYFDDTIESRLPPWKRELEQILEGRNWASFFDRLSGPVPPDIRVENQRSSHSLSDAELLKTFYASSFSPRTKPVELQDHMPGDYFENKPRNHLLWELETGRYHLIECIHS